MKKKLLKSKKKKGFSLKDKIIASVAIFAIIVSWTTIAAKAAISINPMTTTGLATSVGSVGSVDLATSVGSVVSVNPVIVPCACRDTDGGKNLFVKGLTYDKDSLFPFTDACLNGKVVKHWCNASGRLEGNSFDCPPDYICSDGACIANSTSTCRDTNGGQNLFVKGLTYDKGSDRPFTDACLNGKVVKHWCNASGRLEGNSFDCPQDYICSDGACIANSTSTCRDTNGGQNLFVKGLTYDKGADKPHTDACLNGKVVKHWCNASGRLEGNSFDCPCGYTCSDGACIIKM